MKSIQSEPAPSYNTPGLVGFELFTSEDQQVLEQAQGIIEKHYLREYEALRSPELTRRYLQTKLASKRSEVFGVMWLDTRHRVMQCSDLFHGTVDGAAVYPREVVSSGLQCNASAAILYHNHPSGVPEPSQADITLTRRLKEALGLVDIRVLDHMVVGGGESVSLAERGLL